MTRAITDSIGINGVFWDFVYQATLVGLAVAATLAVFAQLANL